MIGFIEGYEFTTDGFINEDNLGEPIYLESIHHGPL